MRSAAIGLALLVLCTGAGAQYRYVDRDGRVVYADQPPAGGSARQLPPVARPAG